MRQLARGTVALTAVMLVAACGGGAGTPAPATSGPAASSAPGTQAASGDTSCRPAESGETTTVEASIAGFEFSAVTAKVGDVITWTNGDTAPHGIMTDDGTCTKSLARIEGNAEGSLVMTKAGTYPFTCTIHPNMKGTMTITE